MLYDLQLRFGYIYEVPASGARHMIRVMPMTLPGCQRLVAGSLTMDPKPAERIDFTDFFGNSVCAVTYRESHEKLDIRMQARVQVDAQDPGADLTPPLASLSHDLSESRAMDGSAPHHYLSESPRLIRNADIAAWARNLVKPDMTVRAVGETLCAAIYSGFDYDPEATKVDTTPAEAFKLKKGVCQDFTHVMIVALRSLGIPAGYVSGYLRTIPPPGKERLEGADAMHAWVRLWCGRGSGWMELDPTNNILAGTDHIRCGHGRDYSDVAPVIGILKSYGSHTTEQAVDVVPIRD